MDDTIKNLSKLKNAVRFKERCHLHNYRVTRPKKQTYTE